MLNYTADTVGVVTSCRPISKECNLSAPYGASTPFFCSGDFNGDLQSYNIYAPNLTYWSDNTSLVFGAMFEDGTFTKPYNVTLRDAPSSLVDIANRVNPFYMGVAARTAFGTSETALQNDSEIVIPVHGGLAFILSCQVATMDVTYSFFNGSVQSWSSQLSNGTVAWYFNSIIGAADSLIYLSQGISVASLATNSAQLASIWSEFYSQEAISILSSIYSSHQNSYEYMIQVLNVTAIPIVPLLLLVGFNLLFAVFGLILSLVARRVNSMKVYAACDTLSVKGLLANLFEENGSILPGRSIEDAFQERTTGDRTGKVALIDDADGGLQFGSVDPVHASGL
jgi:hypothetical protein